MLRKSVGAGSVTRVRSLWPVPDCILPIIDEADSDETSFPVHAVALAAVDIRNGAESLRCHHDGRLGAAAVHSCQTERCSSGRRLPGGRDVPWLQWRWR